MKQFFKFMFASMLGTFVSVFLLFFIFALIIGGFISAAMSDFGQAQKSTKVDENSILHVKLDRPIVDRGPQDQFNINFGAFKSRSNLGLNQIIDNLRKAKDDDNIEGVYLDISSPLAGMATTEEVRNALLDFKASGKWIVAYSEMYSQKAFYLASVADELYLYPEGALDFRGLNVDITFLKNTLDKLDIEPQIIRGSNNKFKSAVEPLIMEEMSQANRLQTQKWLSSLWSTMLSGWADAYPTSEAELDSLADVYAIQYAQDAVDLGFVTALKYNDEVISILKDKVGIDPDEDLELVSFPKYFKAPEPRDKDSNEKPSFDFKRNHIAVVYATGGIESGTSGDEAIGSETFQKAIRDARKDTSVKAIVLRVNSPGGSALASDVIWRETVLAKAEKPVVVSMGDVAASGGYYISCAADKIFAMPNTITGSIGVFGIIPNMKGFFNNKLGMTFDGVSTGEYADFPDVTRPLTYSEERILQKSVDEIYGDFLNRVAEGRGMTPEQVDSIGQGRVWSGLDAIDLGLVDELGGLDAAIEEAARLADVEDYELRDYPKRKDPFQQLLNELTQSGMRTMLGRALLDDPEMIRYYKEVESIKSMRGVQARLPYSVMVR